MEYVYSKAELEQYGRQIILLYDGTTAGAGATDTHTDAKFVGPYKEADFYIVCSAKSGTDPTLDVLVETKHPTLDKWFTIVTFAQLVDVGQERKVLAANLGDTLAIKKTVGGTVTPTFTFSVYAVVKAK